MICVKAYKAPDIDRKEVLRYAGVKEDLPEMAELMETCIHEAAPRLSYRVCYGEFPLTVKGAELDLGFARVQSSDLAKCLKNCTRTLVFAATVGLELDRMIAKYANISPAKALLLDAIGAERIESLCDLLCAEIKAERAAAGEGITPRFSPGYGDLPLEVQQDIFRVLDPARRIGLTLNGSLLMTPSKSVTAIVGIKGI